MLISLAVCVSSNTVTKLIFLDFEQLRVREYDHSSLLRIFDN